ncbi:helix-turn-helix domain-containing protein [Spirosoma radiotolerans]|uniref:AraC family transcriptional regulator n=1 Tax=Spirosoma radiotolerans TaxID=1379870 RepID=A0A0E3V4X9_9BACT|nr:helix-turn-helix transcriptional regulator [Spirosoma radiotolerans]AKD53707.1 AraC family transcriptional regulator [Spirosoma radiotolerans]
MKNKLNRPSIISSPVELHQLLDLPGPLHPLVSLFDNTQTIVKKGRLPKAFLFNFYTISYKKRLKGRTGYGQHYYDFDEGTLVFTAPGQLISTDEDTDYFGISLLFHPDYIRNHPLGRRMKQYGFFSYESNEALHLSEPEQKTILAILGNIDEELKRSLDDFSQDIIISLLEALLNYSNRFYKRQFITRKTVNHELLTKLEKQLDDYFLAEQGLQTGLLTVETLAAQVHVSPRYLSDMLRTLIGQNAQQYIHQKMVEKAKEYLSGTDMTVGEIAYRLGFDYPQSFNKLFKKKTSLTPIKFKQGFHPN